MNPTIIIFAISFFVILFMILKQNYDLNNNREASHDSFKKRMDRFLSTKWFAISGNIARIKNRVVSVIGTWPHRTKLTLSVVWGKIRGKVDSYFEHFHKSHYFAVRGQISNYWKTVADHKDSLKDIK
mgnify:FL=1